jgi:hypothetical protein
MYISPNYNEHDTDGLCGKTESHPILKIFMADSESSPDECAKHCRDGQTVEEH